MIDTGTPRSEDTLKEGKTNTNKKGPAKKRKPDIGYMRTIPDGKPNESYFLHNHPGMEKNKSLTDQHVIVDRVDWERALKNLSPLKIKTITPGHQVTSVRIMKGCRTLRGEVGAIEAAIDIIKDKYGHAMQADDNKDVTFHLTLTIER